MTTEFNELLSVSPTDKSQIWIIGTREQVLHTINEFYVKCIATDRAKFTPFTKCFRRQIHVSASPLASPIDKLLPFNFPVVPKM